MQWLLELSPVVPRFERQDEFHCCSFSCLAVNTDCSAVRFNHFFGQCEPKACSSHSVFSLHPSLIEPVKDVRLILWRDAGPRIADRDVDNAFMMVGRQPKLHHRAVGTILESVGKEI